MVTDSKRIIRETRLEELRQSSHAIQQTLEPMGVETAVQATHSIQAQIRERQRAEFERREEGPIDILQIQQRMNSQDQGIQALMQLSQERQAMNHRAMQMPELRTATEVMLQAEQTRQRIEEAGGMAAVVDRYLASSTVAEINRQRELRLANERAAVRAEGFDVPEPVKPKRELKVNRGARRVRI